MEEVFFFDGLYLMVNKLGILCMATEIKGQIYGVEVRGAGIENHRLKFSIVTNKLK